MCRVRGTDRVRLSQTVRLRVSRAEAPRVPKSGRRVPSIVLARIFYTIGDASVAVPPACINYWPGRVCRCAGSACSSLRSSNDAGSIGYSYSAPSTRPMNSLGAPNLSRPSATFTVVSEIFPLYHIPLHVLLFFFYIKVYIHCKNKLSI